MLDLMKDEADHDCGSPTPASLSDNAILVRWETSQNPCLRHAQTFGSCELSDKITLNAHQEINNTDCYNMSSRGGTGRACPDWIAVMVWLASRSSGFSDAMAITNAYFPEPC